MTRCMLHAKNVSYKIWVEAMFCTTYIINMNPTRALKDITLEEAWSSSKPNLKHLRIFGSISYVHKPKQKRKKKILSFLIIFLLGMMNILKLIEFIILSLEKLKFLEMYVFLKLVFMIVLKCIKMNLMKINLLLLRIILIL